MIAEKFEPLIAAGAVARAGQGGNMGERLFQERRVAEPVPDALVETGGAAAAALRLFRFWRGRFGGGAAFRLRRGQFRDGVTARLAVHGQFGSLRRSRDALGLGLAAHRTIVKKRYQRSAVGQR